MDELLEQLAAIMEPLMATLGPILRRASAANLISPVEQAELTTLLISAMNLFVDSGGTEQELLAAFANVDNA